VLSDIGYRQSAISPNREAMPYLTLDEVVAALAQLLGIKAAHWNDTDEEVTITLSISKPIATIPTTITPLPRPKFNSQVGFPTLLQTSG